MTDGKHVERRDVPGNLSGAVVSRLDRLLVPARTSVYPVILLVLWLPTWAILMARSDNPLMVDLIARWTGGRIVTTGDWPNLYDPLIQEQIQRNLFNGTGAFSWFVGPPFEAVLLAPLGALPYFVALVLWTTASLASLLGALWLVRGDLRFGQVWWRRMVVVALSSMAAIECLFAGQNSTFVLLVVTLSWVALRSGRDFAAGAILGLALVKPHLILLLPLLWLLEGRLKALGGFVMTGTLWTLVAALILDVSTFRDWLDALGSDLYGSAVTLGQTSKHAGPAGFLTEFLASLGLRAGLAASVISLSLGACAVVWVRRREPDTMTRWWLVVLCSVVFASHAMIYDLVIAIPSLAVVLSRWWTASLRVAVALTWVGLWLAGPIDMLTGLSIQGVLMAALTVLVLKQAGQASVGSAR